MMAESLNSKLEALTAADQLLPTVIIVISLADNSVVYMSQSGLQILGVSMEELRAMGSEYHQRFFNAEDAKDYVPKVLGMVERNNNDEVVTCFQQVLHADCDCFKWYSSCTKIFMRNPAGLPIMTITCANAIEDHHYLATKAKRILNESDFVRQHKEVFGQLTYREKEVLALLAAGYTSPEIANRLCISKMTALTHRRNIKRKLVADSDYELTRFAHAFDLIATPDS